jgi:hypothetical protein
MAVGLSPTAAGQMLTTFKTNYTWAQLHVGDPGAVGTANVAAETDRIQVTWTSSVTTQAMANTNLLEWLTVAGSEDYTHISLWTASTAGTFGASGTVTANAVTTGDTFQIPIGDLDVTLPVAS